ncbi:MAG: 6-bladed beta-propeller [Candidatus Kapabacteria bacterium]|jgi:hypothetical protein|nr:6-bladed beta-propeller [Candidatus Kapabacteria bacterium]
MKILVGILFSILLLANECSFRSKGLKDYKPEKLNVDQNYFHSKLTTVDTIILEENEDCIISSIENLRIFDDFIFLIESAGGMVCMFNFKTGKFLKKFEPGPEIIDSIAGSKYPPLPEGDKILRYMQKHEYKERGLTETDIQMIKSAFIDIKQKSNLYYIMGMAYLPTTCDEEKYNVLTNRTFVYICDSNFALQRIISFEVTPNVWSISSAFEVFDNGDYLVSTSNFGHEGNKYFDSLVTFAIYDTEGKLMYNTDYLPDLYANNRLKYNELWRPLTTQTNNTVLINYPRDFNVYATGNKSLFKLHNLPYTNDSGMVHIYDFYRLKKIQQSNPDPHDIGKIVPVTIVKTYGYDDVYGVITLIFDQDVKPMGFYYNLQEYSLEGKLLRQAIIHDEPEYQIRHFGYDKNNNYLCIARKGKDGWTLEKRRWE